MTRLLIMGLLAAAVSAEAPSDPITDRLRFEIAVAQRDYVLAKLQYDSAKEHLRGKTAEAQAACDAQGQQFSPEQFRCVEKTAPKKNQ